MKIIRLIKEMSNFSCLSRQKGKTIGFIPTMGALHAGHLSLIRCARKENDLVVVSIFVNPSQFGPKEDFKKYPRNLKKDAALCKNEGVDVIFYPLVTGIYPAGFKTYVEVKELSDMLCAKSRPGHFKGVATVVTKLFNIVLPDTAYFGQKDAQQAVIIKRVVMDLNLAVRIKVMPIIREKDGLAMSSRNAYLDKKERKSAAVLYMGLKKAEGLIKKGAVNPQYIIRRMKNIIEKERAVKIDYISIVDAEDLRPLKRIKGKILLALAVRIGKVRLIDNLIING